LLAKDSEGGRFPVRVSGSASLAPSLHGKSSFAAAVLPSVSVWPLEAGRSDVGPLQHRVDFSSGFSPLDGARLLEEGARGGSVVLRLRNPDSSAVLVSVRPISTLPVRCTIADGGEAEGWMVLRGYDDLLPADEAMPPLNDDAHDMSETVREFSTLPLPPSATARQHTLSIVLPLHLTPSSDSRSPSFGVEISVRASKPKHQLGRATASPSPPLSPHFQLTDVSTDTVQVRFLTVIG
jgi:hypothetical protein